MWVRIYRQFILPDENEEMIVQMLVSEETEEIEAAENLIFGKTLVMLQEFEPVLKQMGLHILLSVEGWCLEKGRIVKVKQAPVSSKDNYEAVLTLYPANDHFVLRNEQTGEIPGAAVVCCRRECVEGVWKVSEDRNSIPKLYGQLIEVLDELKNGGYIQDEIETDRIRQDTKKIYMY